MEKLESEITKLKERNVRVESDKRWELCNSRRIIISIGTYLFAALFLVLINAPNPFLVAIVPAVGFIFSTLTLPFFKEWWLGNKTH
ncbi:hypothetical protein HY988_02275 [Candidatus Micrarchaeota archaeon]|nr:hypothetical protein [Candidatus Micrarchaeota archaeon]